MKIMETLCHARTFRRGLEENRPRLYRAAYSWCHDPHLADDLVQLAMTKALKSSKQLREIEQLDRWLFRILANCHKDHYRASRDLVLFDEENDGWKEDETPEHETSRVETIERVRAAINTLPINQRQTLSLVDLEGFTYNEVAEILDIPIGTVMSRLCRARRALKQLLLDLAPNNADMRSRIRRVK